MSDARFKIRNLAILGYAQGFTSWLYRTVDTSIRCVEQDNFFGDASHMVQPGDMITVTGPDGGRIVFVTKVADVVSVRSPSA